jgi:hypothetical protein
MSDRGWSVARAGLLLLAAAFLTPLDPLVLVGVPMAVMLAAFRGRSPVALALAGVLLLLAFSDLPADPGPVWMAERGWALALGGGFVAATALWEDRGVLTRGLAGLAAALGVTGVVAALQPGTLMELDWWVERELSSAALAAHDWIARAGWPSAETGGVSMQEVLSWQVLLHPALLGLASLAALAVGWFVVRRLDGADAVLGPFREFRFRGELVWVLLAGMALFLVPAGGIATRMGENAIFFMGGLYLLRGMAVLFWVGSATVTSIWSAALWIAAGVLLYPLAVLCALVLGLGDTWVDVRGRLARRITRG